jgi:hypothetical protein
VSSITDRLDDRPLLAALLKGCLGGAAFAVAGYVAAGTVPVAGAVAFGSTFAVLTLVFARRGRE